MSMERLTRSVFCLFLLIVACELVSSSEKNDMEVKTRERRTASRGRTRTSSQGGGLHRGLQHMLLNGGNLAAYTPAPVSPDEVDCQVGVEETRYHDGRCIRLGNSQRPACQAGIHLDISNNECNRQAAGGSSSSSGGGGGRSRGRNRGSGQSRRYRNRDRN